MSKGDFLLHLGPEMHERLRLASEKEHVSMAQMLKEGLELRLSAGQPTPSVLLQAVQMVARAALELAEKGAPPPQKPETWDDFLHDSST